MWSSLEAQQVSNYQAKLWKNGKLDTFTQEDHARGTGTTAGLQQGRETGLNSEDKKGKGAYWPRSGAGGGVSGWEITERKPRARGESTKS